MDCRTYIHTRAGWSEEPDDALDSEQTLVVLFGASGLIDAPGPVERVIETFPRAAIMGCSSAGEIHGARIYDGSLAVGIARFRDAALRAACARIEGPGKSRAAGADIARRLDRPDLRAVLILSDGLQVNGSELVRGVNSVLPPSVAVTGGLAGDGDRFQRTWVIAGRRLAPGYVSAVGLYGEGVRVGHGSKGGWDAFGMERMVTRARGNVLYELDGKPALELYKEYLGDRAGGLPAAGLRFPLTLRAGGDNDKRLVRTILAVDEASQSMTFAGDIPEGSYAQLMHANFDRLIQGAGEAALSTRGEVTENRSALAIAISCVGRRLVLGERAEEETEAACLALPRAARQIGFYSYGEISPYASGHCDLHNQTMTLTTIHERQ
ncbi:MAG: FIST C-terminal domain-containing protein [Burkholderiales bacterium]|nr:FIST C-terminal domain-containing protein [Burkholderiales bacterium]